MNIDKELRALWQKIADSGVSIESVLFNVEYKKEYQSEPPKAYLVAVKGVSIITVKAKEAKND